MGIRAVTGYIAHVALVVYWVWVVVSTAPQLRKGTRDRHVRARALAIKSAGFVLTAVVVGIIHYWATAWWQVIVTVPVAAALGVLLHREYRHTVAAPPHAQQAGSHHRPPPQAAQRRRPAPPARQRGRLGGGHTDRRLTPLSAPAVDVAADGGRVPRRRPSTR